MSFNVLEEIEQIKKLKARYFRLMDTKRWKEWSNVFTEDATIRVINTNGKETVWKGREQIVSNNSSYLKDVTTVHHGHMPEVEVTSSTTATGIWAMFDYVISSERILKGYGHYHEEYVKEDGSWKIRSLLLTRLREDRYGNNLSSM